ncbi:MAG: hypothetical protein JJ896_14045 [Rhodothermales bacterium]|nr:hypothetical protein [Rhodothermales bacterium]MBO6780770.1 hypothetical protein [Rhodothermales bacterium]
MRSILLVLLALVVLPAGAQVSPGWQAHTSYRSILAVDADGGTLWAATKGGVFSFSESGEVVRYSVIDGLASVETRTIEADAVRGVVWVGYSSGVFDKLDPETGAVTTFRDIERADQFAARGINRVSVLGDSVLVATDFGIVVFDPARNEVRDSFTRLGSFSAAISVNDVLVAPDENGVAHIWAATDEGLAFAPLAAGLNLQDPASWRNEASAFMGSRDDATALAYFDGLLYVGSSVDLYARRGPDTYERKFVSSSGIRRMDVLGDRLFGVERFNMFQISAGGQGQILAIPGFIDPTGVVVTGASSAWVGDEFGGLLRVSVGGAGQVSVDQVVVPDGPGETQFSNLAIAPDGTLFAGGSTEAGSGFHRLSPDGSWTAFTPALVAELAGTGSWLNVATDAAGNGWIGSEGAGAARVAPDGSLDRFGPSNSSLLPSSGSTDFVIVGGLAADSEDNMWITTRASARPLHVRSADGEWTALGPYVGDGLSVRATAYADIFVDAFDQKWIIVRSENNFNAVRGLMVLDTGSTPDDESDDSFQFFDAPGADGSGLPSPRVSAVVEDRDGRVWIGTDTGLAFFVNTGVVARDPLAFAQWPRWADRSRGGYVLFGLQVNDLAVDPANRLWVATNEGAWLIEEVERGYDLVDHFSTDSSPLFSDNVLSVSVDPASGRVFFATDRGLLSYDGGAIAPVESAGDLFVYPNPARGGEEVVIEGLVESAQVRIVTPSGDTVAAFASRGGRARWNGRAMDGSPVPTGMYLVIAVGDDGQGASYGRLAVIR